MRKTKGSLLAAALLASSVFAADITDKVIPELRLRNGTVIHNVRIVSFGSVALMAKWDGGRGTLQYDDLPADMLAQVSPFRKKPAPPTSTVGVHPTPKLSFPEVDLTPIAPINGPAAAAATIRGQCFVATKGGQNIKLGLVRVGIYPKAAFDSYRAEIISRVRMRDDAIRKASDEALAQRDLGRVLDLGYLGRAQAHSKWELLPSPVASVLTDADGNFELIHTVAAPFVVFARAQRLLGENTEYLLWIIQGDQVPPGSRLFLSNNNEGESGR